MAFRSILLIAFCRVTVLAQLSTTTDPSTPTIIPVKPETNSSGDVDAQYRLEFDKCTDDQVAQIKSGFADAITMIMGRNTWTIWPTYPTVDWNSGVAQDFWGPAERNLQYRELIQANLNRLASVTYQYSVNPFASKIHVRCDDPNTFCEPQECALPGTRVTAYNINHEPHINFCPGYFVEKTLSEALTGGWTEAGYMFNKASVWVHELMHIGEIGHDVFSTEKGGVEDKLLRNWRRNDGQKVYGPKFTKWHAQDPSGLYSEVVENADNYAYFVTMNFMQKNLGYYISDPQIQISPQDYEDLATENVTTESRNDGDDRCRWV